MDTAPRQATEFYSRLAATRQDTEELQGCIRQVLQQFKRVDPTTPSRPGMLLGKVEKHERSSASLLSHSMRDTTLRSS
jgi:hypothetical protein